MKIAIRVWWSDVDCLSILGTGRIDEYVFYSEFVLPRSKDNHLSCHDII